uniref:Exocyst complex component EXO70B1-like n=1 Tax=Mesocestoides corti TaxID=53468 RepID=A0A5K3F048_MESCO
MPFLKSDEYLRICKDAKNCTESARKMTDSYTRLVKDHSELRKATDNSGLSTLNEFLDIEEKDLGLFKYMEALDKTFLLEPLSLWNEGGKRPTTDGEVANAISKMLEINPTRAKHEAVAYLGESLCAHLCASSNMIVSGPSELSKEVEAIEKQTWTGNNSLLDKVDEIISDLNKTYI